MNILAVEIEIPYAVDVRATEDTLTIDLSARHTISVPLGWYPRLEHASSEERANWRLIGRGQGNPLGGYRRRHKRGGTSCWEAFRKESGVF